MEITFTIENKGDFDQVNFAGDINEDAEIHLTKLLDTLKDKVVFNLRAISSVNSCGVRAWINFIREAEQNRTLTFEECTPEIVSQINMIPNFRGTAQVKSVYASYACDSCDNEQLKLFEKGRNLPSSSEDEIEELKCPKCGELMEMDELEEEFFSWLDVA